ncbi:hypothetical protein [Paenibacillus xylaniclasticus]|uniref:hypothetical protein n=1 Tax=Paenibacillus xylaniclasticus TaxID=588083 RepID=UPI000FD730DD|nr:MULTISPECIES: hypothetical protein [Paenibacillus]GFN30969.1 hypothetical protein PCURB6_12290 [Paenibacillus curdlanolyticus]
MKDNLSAVYLGREYEAGIKGDGQIILRSQDAADTAYGFELYRGIVYVKVVPRTDIESIYLKHMKAVYNHIEFTILDERADELLLSTMQGDYIELKKLGFEVVDQGVYHKWVSEDQIERRFEIRELFILE